MTPNSYLLAMQRSHARFLLGRVSTLYLVRHFCRDDHHAVYERVAHGDQHSVLRVLEGEYFAGSFEAGITDPGYPEVVSASPLDSNCHHTPAEVAMGLW